MKKLILGIAFVTLAVANVTVFAASARGTISQYHVNSLVPERGSCVQMEPSIPTSTGYACLYTTTWLYLEMNAMLLNANMLGRVCSVEWTETDGYGHAKINAATCY